MSQLPILFFTEGDRLDELFFEFEDVNLAIYDSIRLVVFLESGDYLRDDSSNPYIDATIIDAAAGTFRFIWPTAGLPEGQHEGVVKFTQTVVGEGVKVETIPDARSPLRLHVAEGL